MTQNKSILILLGNSKEPISKLIKNGTPRTLVIQTKKVPEKGQSVDVEAEKDIPPFQIQRSMLAALVNDEFDIFVIDRDNIDNDDFGAYAYAAKVKPCPLQTLEVKLDSIMDYTDKSNRNIIIIDGENPGELIQLLMKGAHHPVLISSENIAVHEERIRLDVPAIEFAPADVWDTFFFDAITNKGNDLLIATQAMITDYPIIKRLAHAYKCNLFTIKIILEKKQSLEAIRNTPVKKSTVHKDNITPDVTQTEEIPTKPFSERLKEIKKRFLAWVEKNAPKKQKTDSEKSSAVKDWIPRDGPKVTTVPYNGPAPEIPAKVADIMQEKEALQN